MWRATNHLWNKTRRMRLNSIKNPWVQIADCNSVVKIGVIIKKVERLKFRPINCPEAGMAVNSSKWRARNPTKSECTATSHHTTSTRKKLKKEARAWTLGYDFRFVANVSRLRSRGAQTTELLQNATDANGRIVDKQTTKVSVGRFAMRQASNA